MLTEGENGGPVTRGEETQQQGTAPPASAMAALARQLAQAKLSEAELQQRLRSASLAAEEQYVLMCLYCLRMCEVLEGLRTPVLTLTQSM